MEDSQVIEENVIKEKKEQPVGFGEPEFHGANVGGLMRIDHDNMRLGVLSSDGTKAHLDVYLRADPNFRRVQPVVHRSVFEVGGYRVEVVTLGERDVAVEVTRVSC